jgi:hypothetical protein
MPREGRFEHVSWKMKEDGAKVTIEIFCADAYQAIELAGGFEERLKTGRLTINFYPDARDDN